MITNEDAEAILDNLPRASLKEAVRKGAQATVSIDDSGCLIIAINGEGFLALDEVDQYLLYNPDY